MVTGIDGVLSIVQMTCLEKPNPDNKTNLFAHQTIVEAVTKKESMKGVFRITLPVYISLFGQILMNEKGLFIPVAKVTSGNIGSGVRVAFLLA